MQRLNGYRVDVSLACCRRIPAASEPPVAAIESVVKGVKSSLPSHVIAPKVSFHITGKPLRFDIRRGEKINVAFLLNTPDKEIAQAWHNGLIRWFTAPPGIIRHAAMELDILPALDTQAIQTMLETYKKTATCYKIRTGLSCSHLKDVASLLVSARYIPRNFLPKKEVKVRLRTINNLYEESVNIKKGVRVFVHTPLPVTGRKRPNEINAQDIIKMFIKPLIRFFSCIIPDEKVERMFKDVCIDTTGLKYERVKHKSNTQPGRHQLINGYCGRVDFTGNVTALIPLLLLCAEINAGSSESFGRGHVSLQLLNEKRE